MIVDATDRPVYEALKIWGMAEESRIFSKHVMKVVPFIDLQGREDRKDAVAWVRFRRRGSAVVSGVLIVISGVLTVVLLGDHYNTEPSPRLR